MDDADAMPKEMPGKKKRRRKHRQPPEAIAAAAPPPPLPPTEAAAMDEDAQQPEAPMAAIMKATILEASSRILAADPSQHQRKRARLMPPLPAQVAVPAWPKPRGLRHIERVLVISHCKEAACAQWRDRTKRHDVRKRFKDYATWCDGRNHDIQERIINGRSRNFKSLCKEVREDMEAERSQKFTLQIYCRSGKHRSVACNEVFARIFRGLGMDVVVEHRCLFEHGRSCSCSRCSEAALPASRALLQLFKDA
jgi:hypothetical protein